MRYCVLHIPAAGNIFEVIGLVIGLVPIFMIDFLPIWARTNKCICNQPMYVHIAIFAVYSWHNLHVPIREYVRL